MDTKEQKYRMCIRCLCDTTIPSIKFDDRGVCNFCQSHDILIAYFAGAKQKKYFNDLIMKIKRTGDGKRYDCLVGVSGGTDSTFTLYWAKKMGLRPLAVHFDNGWDKEEAVNNIKKAVNKLGIDLYTYVVNWEEFKDLQVAFLKASVPDAEVPTDIGIHGTLYKIAKQEKIKYILGGQCFKAEGTVPVEWSFIDGTYVKSVHQKFGTKPLKTFPNVTIWSIAFNTIFLGIKQIPILNYINYDKASAQRIMEEELDWQYYGGHHYENAYSQFAFGYYSLVKFNIDKRKISLSGPLRMGLISRKEALEQIKNPPGIPEEAISYCIKKLGLKREEFDKILSASNKSFRDYRTSYPWLKHLDFFIKLAASLNLISPVVYEKFINH